MVDLLVNEFLDVYTKYVITTHKGSKMLYTRANKAIYGTLKAALLFWEKLSGKFNEWGFMTNSYDRCTVNKIINGKQCTCVWHFDDVKISHADRAVVVEDIIDLLKEEFGKISPLTIVHGEIHEYLGMTLDYSAKGKVTFSTYDYLEEIVGASLPEPLLEAREIQLCASCKPPVHCEPGLSKTEAE